MAVIKKYYPATPGKAPQLKECYEVNDLGRRDGFYQSWHPNGQEYITATYRNDRPFGAWSEKHPNGRLAVQKSFDTSGFGTLEGDFKQFRADGSRELFGAYANNRPHGVFTMWNTDNSIKSVDTYMMGYRHGESIDYAEDTICRTTYAYNKEDETIQSSCRRSETLIYKRKIGDYQKVNRTFYADGSLQREEFYYWDSARSEERLYYPGSKQIRLKIQKDGLGYEDYTLFSEAGHKLETGSRQDGKRTGCRRLYYDTDIGSLREECAMKDDLEEGLCLQYDPQGHVTDRYYMHQGEKVTHPHMIEVLFGKRREKKVRQALAQKLWAVLKQPTRSESDLAELHQFHTQPESFPRPTVLKLKAHSDRSRA